MLPLTNHSSTQLDPFKYTEQPRLRAIVFLAEAVSLARMGMLPKTWSTPRQLHAFLQISPQNHLSRLCSPPTEIPFQIELGLWPVLWPKFASKAKWLVDFQPVCFVACFLTLDTSRAGSLNGQRIDNIPCTSYFISKHPS